MYTSRTSPPASAIRYRGTSLAGLSKLTEGKSRCSDSLVMSGNVSTGPKTPSEIPIAEAELNCLSNGGHTLLKGKIVEKIWGNLIFIHHRHPQRHRLFLSAPHTGLTESTAPGQLRDKPCRLNQITISLTHHGTEAKWRRWVLPNQMKRHHQAPRCCVRDCAQAMLVLSVEFAKLDAMLQ